MRGITDMDVAQIFSLVTSITPALIIKLFLLVLSAFYFVFTIVIYRQIGLMSQTVKTTLSALLKLVAILQIMVVGGLFVLVLLFV